MVRVRFRLPRASTIAAASGHVRRVFARGFIGAVPPPGMQLNLGNADGAIHPYGYGIRLDAEVGRSADQFGLGVDAELVVDGRQVALDRALAQEQALGDLVSGLSARCQESNLAFPPAERP